MAKSQTILFVGDSLIEFFDWQARFPLHQITNLGWSGETVQELAWRSKEIASAGYDPEWIIIMIGTNNVAMNDFSFLQAYTDIVDTFQQGIPNSKIALTGLFPMRLPWIADDTILRLNEQLQKLADSKECSYMDGWGDDSDALDLNRGFSDDGVHLSDYGYTLWSETVEKFLDQNK